MCILSRKEVKFPSDNMFAAFVFYTNRRQSTKYKKTKIAITKWLSGQLVVYLTCLSEFYFDEEISYLIGTGHCFFQMFIILSVTIEIPGDIFPCFTQSDFYTNP